MTRKRTPPADQTEQLVFPFSLRVGDVILDDGTRAEVVTSPTTEKSGKTTRVWVRHQGETVQREVVWGAWHKVRMIRRVLTV